MRIRDFLATRPVFSHDEFLALPGEGSRHAGTREALLGYYRRAGRVVRVRRGLYLTVPPGTSPDACPVDPYLLAGRMAADAVLAYHTAIEFHGRAYSVHERFLYLTRTAARPVTFRGYRFLPVSVPLRLHRAGRADLGVAIAERQGQDIRVTSLERTLVDVLDRPELSGGWEEIWRSLEAVPFFDLDQVIAYALALGNATTIAKVGFYMEQHRDALMVEDLHLERLQRRRPRQPRYMDRAAGPGRFVAGWNLVVPAAILDRTWEESA